MNSPAIISIIIKSNLVKDQIVEFFDIWSPYMLQLLVHGFNKRKTKALVADFTTTKNSYFYSHMKEIWLQLSYIFLTSYKILQFSFLKEAFSPG